jgi:hypothetical protein
MRWVISSVLIYRSVARRESERFFCLWCEINLLGVVGLRSWRIDTMGKQKRPVLEGEDDGEGHSWKVLKANGGTVDVYYGKGGHARFQLKKADKTTPIEQLVLQRIAEHRDAKRKQQDDDEGGGGGKKAKGSRLAAEAAAVTSEAESSMSPSGSKEDRRVQRTFPHLSTPGRLDRDYDAERRSADERREDGSDMCHILKLVAMAIFSQRGGSELGPSSPEEKLRPVADLVSSELQGMLKQHKAASVGGAAGKQLPGVAGGRGRRRRRRRRRRGAKGGEAGAAERGRATRCSGYAGGEHTGIAEVKWGAEVKRKSQLESGGLKGWLCAGK